MDSTQSNPKAMAKGLFLATVGAIAFSGKAIIVKLAYRHGVDAVTLIMLRMLFAMPFFVAMVVWSQRKAQRITSAGSGVHDDATRRMAAALTFREWLGVAWLGLTGYYLASFLDFAGLQYISASLERLILYLNPTIVLVLGLVLYRKKVNAMQALGMAVSYAGVLLVFGHEASLSGRDVGLGALLVLLSAISYAVYLSYSGEMVKRLGSMRLVGLATTVACFLCIVQFVLLRPLQSVLDVAPQVLWLSLFNAVFCTVVPVLLVMMAIERIGAGLAAQAGMIGPMSTILMGVLILGEPMSRWVVIGTVFVLAGVAVCSRSARKT